MFIYMYIYIFKYIYIYKHIDRPYHLSNVGQEIVNHPQALTINVLHKSSRPGRLVIAEAPWRRSFSERSIETKRGVAANDIKL